MSEDVKPTIESPKFGAITIAGTVYRHDAVIRLDGSIDARPKELSEGVYGTSHQVSLGEAQAVYEPGASRLIVGAGRFGRVRLSDEASSYFEERGCRVTCWPTNKAVDAWNKANGAVVGRIFHLTC